MKQIKVESCAKCPNYGRLHNFSCQRSITDINTIHPDCPLEDYPDAGNGKAEKAVRLLLEKIEYYLAKNVNYAIETQDIEMLRDVLTPDAGNTIDEDKLCEYCPLDKKGVYGVPGGFMAGCEGSKCDDARDNYEQSEPEQPEANPIDEVQEFVNKLNEWFKGMVNRMV
jgi:hypothetical protein